MGAAISSAVAQRPITVLSVYACFQSGRFSMGAVSGVSTTPGARAFTRIPDGSPFRRRGAGELHDPRLGRRIDPLPRLHYLRADRGEEHDASATGPREARRSVAEGVKGSLQVQRDDSLELLFAGVGDPLADVHPRGGDEASRLVAVRLQAAKQVLDRGRPSGCPPPGRRRFPPSAVVALTTRAAAASSRSATTTRAPDRAAIRTLASPMPEAPPITTTSIPSREKGEADGGHGGRIMPRGGTDGYTDRLD